MFTPSRLVEWVRVRVRVRVRVKDRDRVRVRVRVIEECVVMEWKSLGCHGVEELLNIIVAETS